jgi:zinc transport system substrate-binding protein
MNIKRILGIITLIILLVTLVLVRLNSQIQEKASITSKISIVTSFYPLAEFAQQIAGDKAVVFNLVPAGAEPHDFEPSPQDIATLTESNLFIYNGAGFETWISKVQNDLDTNNVLSINSSQDIQLIQTDSDQNSLDPHIWLDPVLAQDQVSNIKNALVKVDPQNQEFYENNANLYIDQLKNLDSEFQQTLSSCEKNTIVASHNAFTYLAKRYNFSVISISGLSPDEEPSAQKLAEISQYARSNQIQYIFFESLVSPKLSDTIAQEVNAKTLVFNPIEGLTPEELSEGKNYIQIQKENLQNLKTALQCQKTNQ